MDLEQHSLDQSYENSLNSSNLESQGPVQTVVQPEPDVVQGGRQSAFRFNRRAFLITGAALVIILTAGITTILFANSNNQDSPQSALEKINAYSVGSLPVSAVKSNDSLTLGQANYLSINGQLKVSNTLIITPTTTPTTPSTGQIYYDKNSNLLNYYNGTEFIALNGGGQGAAGPAGQNGLPGAAGAAGAAGVNGSNGAAGATGPQGLQGPPGTSGTATCPNGTCLSLQATSPGVVETGNVNISGALLSGSLVTSGNLTVGGSITFSVLSSSGVVHTNSSGVLSTGAVVLGSETSGNYVANIGAVVGLSTTGNSGSGSTPTLSVLYGSTANTAVQGNTAITCATGTGNLSGGGNSITLGSGGSCNNLTITNSPTFSGNLAVQGSGGVTVGVAGATDGVIKLANSSNANLGSIISAALGQATTYILPDPSLGSVTICLSTGNCAGSGNGITGSGTAGQLAKFSAGGNIVDSNLNETGTSLTYAGSAVVNAALGFIGNLLNLTVNGSSKFSIDQSGNSTQAGTLTVNGGGASAISGSLSVGTGLTVTNGGLTVSNGGATVTGPITFGSLGAGVVQSTAGGVVSSGSIDRNAGTYFNTTLTVANGGTGAGSLTANGILYGNGTSSILATSAGANSILATDGSNVPSLTQTLPTAVQGNITSTGALIAGSIGSGFGAISTANNIGTTAGLQGATLTLGTSTTSTGSIAFKNATNSNTVTLQSGVSGSNFSLTLPTTGGSNGDCLQSQGGGVLVFTACTGGAGGGVTSLDSQTGVLTLANSTGSAGTITIDDALANGTTKGIATFNSTNFTATSGVVNTVQNINSSAAPTFGGLGITNNATVGGTLGVSGITTLTGQLNANGGIVTNNANIDAGSGNITSGLINGQTISSTANFTGIVTIQGASLTIGTPGTTTGSLNLANSSSTRQVILQGLNPSGTGNATIQIPSIAGGGTDTVCLYTLGNCAGVGGGITGSGTLGQLAKFSSSGSITDSILSESGTVVSSSGSLNAVTSIQLNGANINTNGTLNNVAYLNGTNSFSAANTFTAAGTALTVNNNATISGTGTIGNLTVTSTTTLSSLNSAGVVHTNGSGVLSTSAVVLGSDTTGSYVANLGSLTGLTTTGNSGAGSTPTLSVTYGSGANTSAQGNTALSFTGAGNLTGTVSGTAGGGITTNTLAIVSSPTFSGTLNVQGAGGITIGDPGTTAGNLNLANAGSSRVVTLQGLNPSGTGNATIQIPSIAGGSTDTVCLYTLNNCASASGITGSGTAGKITKFTGTNTVGDSILSESGTVVTATGTLNATTSFTLGGANINTNGTLNNVAYLNGTNSFSAANTFTAAGTALTVNNNATISGTLTSGLINGQTISSAANFTGTVSVQGAGGLTIGVPGTTAGNLNLSNATSTRQVVLQGLNPSGTGNATIQIPSIAGGSTDTVCLYTLANCTGVGGGITGGGTTGNIAKFSGSGSITDSTLSESGTVVTASGSVVIQGAGALTLGTSTTSTGSIAFKNATNSNTVTLQSGVSGSNFSLTLPTTGGSNGDCLQSQGGGVLVFTACTGGAGGGVTSLDSQTGVLTLANSTGSAGTITIDDALANGTTKGIATFNSTNFTATSGVVNTVQNINSSAAPTFSTLTLNGTGKSAIALSDTSTTTGITIGGDTNLYRAAANNLKTDDTFDAAAYKVGGVAGATTTCGGGQVLTAQAINGGIVTGGSCVSGSSLVTLQNAYDNGSSLITSDANDIIFNLSDTTTDSNFVINIDPTSDGIFQIQNGGVFAFGVDKSGAFGNTQTIILADGSIQSANFAIAADGEIANQNAHIFGDGTLLSNASGGKTTLALASTAADTGITIGGDTNLYRSAADTLKTDDDFIVAGTITSGLINGQTISTTANFTGTVSVQGASLTIGDPGTTAGNLNLANAGSSRVVTLQGLNPSGTGNATIQIPSIAGGSTDTVCLYTLNNCASASGITGSGTAGKITKFTGTNTVGDSILSESGTVVTATGTLNATTSFTLGGANINTNGTLNNVAYLNGTNSFSAANTFTAAGTALTVNNNATIGGVLDVTGNLNVNTNKFQVIASNGNTSVGGTLGVTGSTTLTGALTVNNTAYINTNSTTALKVENSTGNTNVFVVDTTNNRVGIGGAPSGASALQVFGAVAASGNITTNSGSFTSTGTAHTLGGSAQGSTTLSLSSNSSNTITPLYIKPNEASTRSANYLTIQASTFMGGGAIFTINSTGGVLSKNTANSTTAFQIQDSAGTSNLFNADTTNTRIGIGTATPGYTLDVAGNINTNTAYLLGGANINTNGTLNNVAYLNGTNSFSAANTFTAAGTALTVNNNATISGTLTSGLINGQTISSAANFTGTVSVQGAGGLTIGVPGTTAGNLNLSNATSTRQVVLQGLNPSGTGNATIQIPSIAGGSTDTVCLYTLANCGGVGAITGSGISGNIAKFNGTGSITNSGLTEAGTTLTYGGNAVINAANGFTGNLLNLQVNASSKYSVNELGNSTQAGILTVNGTGTSTIAGSLTIATGETITSGGLLVSAGGATISGATTVSGGAILLNNNSNNNTSINTGTSTGTVSIGNNLAGSIALQSSNAINLTAGAASTISTGAGNLTLQAGSGTVTLGLSTALTNTSGGLAISSGGAGALTLASGSGTVSTSSAFTTSNAGGKTTLQLTDTGANTGLTIGGDTNLYRIGTGQLKTDGALFAGTSLVATSSVYANNGSANTVVIGVKDILNTVAPAIVFGNLQDTNLYRSAADTLKTDDSLVVAGSGNGSSTYGALFKNGTDSSTAFQIQTSTGASVLTANTSTSQVVLGSNTNNASLRLFVASGTTPGILVDTSAGAVGDSAYIGFNSSRAAFGYDGSAGNAQIVAGGSKGFNVTVNNTTSALNITSTGAALFKNGTDSATAFQIQNSTGGPLFTADTTSGNKLITNGDLVANGSATATTGTTAGTGGSNVTSITLSAAGGFANGDVIFVDNTGGSGQDYYTRITAGGGTTTLTVSPAVSYGTAAGYTGNATITKYNVQSIGAVTSTNSYTTQSNRYFQGYFLGGVVTGAGSTTLSDGNLQSSTYLNLLSATASTFATTAGNLTLQAGSGTVSLGSSSTLTATGALAVSSGGSGQLTLTSGSGTISLSSTTTLTASGALTVSSGGAGQLTLTSGSGTVGTGSNFSTAGYLQVTAAANASGNLRFSAANPYIVASSYTYVPGGLYVNGGTLYAQNQLQARGGVHDDTNASLTIAGGTSGATNFSGGSITLSGDTSFSRFAAGVALVPILHAWDGAFSADCVFGTCGNGNISIENTSGDLPGLTGYEFPVLKSTGTALYISVNGAYSSYIDSGGVYHQVSDKTKKENYTPLDDDTILDKLNQLPVEQWNYIDQDDSIKHIGPYAQDFHALFGLSGTDDKMIALQDTIGVSLAGVKALNTKYKQVNATVLDQANTLSLQSTAINDLTDTVTTLTQQVQDLQNGSVSVTNLDIQGQLTAGDLNVSGTATITDLTVQSLDVQGDLALQGNLTVQGLTKVQDIIVSGHVITAGDIPTSQVLTAAGSGALVSVSGSDTTGTISITTGNTPSAGELAKLIFSKTYGANPRVVLSPSNDAASSLRFFKGTTALTDFIFNAKDVPVANTTYNFDYFIAQ